MPRQTAKARVINQDEHVLPVGTGHLSTAEFLGSWRLTALATSQDSEARTGDKVYLQNPENHVPTKGKEGLRCWGIEH